MCETEGNNQDGSKAHWVFDFARGWARRRAGGGSSTTNWSDGRNSSGGRLAGSILADSAGEQLDQGLGKLEEVARDVFT